MGMSVELRAARRQRLIEILSRFIPDEADTLTDFDFVKAVYAKWEWDKKFAELVDPNE